MEHFQGFLYRVTDTFLFAIQCISKERTHWTNERNLFTKIQIQKINDR